MKGRSVVKDPSHGREHKAKLHTPESAHLSTAHANTAYSFICSTPSGKTAQRGGGTSARQKIGHIVRGSPGELPQSGSVTQTGLNKTISLSDVDM